MLLTANVCLFNVNMAIPVCEPLIVWSNVLSNKIRLNDFITNKTFLLMVFLCKSYRGITIEKLLLYMHMCYCT